MRSNDKQSEKFQNKYRIKSARLKGYDYSSEGSYFITICVKNRRPILSSIVDANVQLSSSGEISYSIWNMIPDHFPFVLLDEFIIMPDHLHGIVTINHSPTAPIGTVGAGGITKNKNPMLHYSISRIIRWFKGKTTFEIRKSDVISDFQWQARFFDRIIRNEYELNKIRYYIIQNPLSWELKNNDDSQI